MVISPKLLFYSILAVNYDAIYKRVDLCDILNYFVYAKEPFT